MTARGRNNNDQDIMKDDYNNSFYDSHDDDCGAVQYDHCRLYILNIPKGLSEEGLRTAFNKYGTLTEVYVSKDPNKKYALVRYETPGEAKLAMTKLNNTDPMKLHISIARKPKVKKDNNYSRDSVDRSYSNGPSKRSFREDNASITSKKSSRLHEDLTNGDEMEETLPSVDVDMDPEIKIKSLQLELQRLQVQEQTVLLRQQLFQLEAARKKNLTQTTPSNRCILPDGRIVVRNVNERSRKEKTVTWSLEPRDVEGSFAAGAGDSLTIPALQRGCACVACGAPADSFCARCGLTPYCSPSCQRRDWQERHRACCHNLARMAGRVDSGASEQVLEKEVLPQAPPLRQPHCATNKPSPRKEEDAMPALTESKKPQHNNNNKQQDTRNNRRPRNFNNNHSMLNNKNRQGQNDRRQQRQDEPDEQEDWGNKNSTAQAASSPAKPCPKPAEATPPPAPAPPVAKPQQEPRPKAVPKAPGSLTDTTPATKGGKKLVPDNYLIDLLSPGDTALLSVEAAAADCRAPHGFVCLSMHERFETQYQDLCEQYAADCEAETGAVTPAPGDTFSYFNPADGGWYRARLLTAYCAALLDAGKLAALPADKLRPLPARHAQTPEFCCLLTATVQVGDSLTCKLISKTPDGWKVSLSKVDTGAFVGEGEVTRWLPAVDYPAPVAVPTPAPAASSQIPEVPRPDVINNSRVVLVDATGFERASVRPSDAASQRRFDQTLAEVVMYARTAAPLPEPPQMGQVVIGKFTDGLFYRALCKRTNVKQNKYMLEYIEFGNVEVTPLENIYPCPKTLQLTARPTEVSLVTLQCKAPCVFSAQATEYLDSIKDELQELILTLPSGEGSAPSGASVCLTEVRTNEGLNRKLETMCTPDWKKLEEKGADVVELKPLMYAELECLELPLAGGALEVLDVSALAGGSLSACPARHPHAAHVLGALTDQMAEYCNSDLGKKPYLPKPEELCIARFPPYPQWFRAVLLEQTPGSATARVCYVDYGNVAEVPVEHLRKMLPEFVRGRPALASHLDIKDFPKNPTPEMLARAVEHMQINDEGRGTLQVARCVKHEAGLYAVHAPALIRAMTQ